LLQTWVEGLSQNLT